MDEAQQSRDAPVKPVVTPSVLDQLDVRVGRIEAVADVPGSDKLVELTVDFGRFQRDLQWSRRHVQLCVELLSQWRDHHLRRLRFLCHD